MASEKCRNVFTAGTHGTTFGGNPVGAAAACCVLDTINQDFLDKVKEKGDYLRTQIEAMDIPCLGKTRGMGLMIGIEVKGDRTNRELAAALAGFNRSFSQEEMDKGLAILKNTLS